MRTRLRITLLLLSLFASLIFVQAQTEPALWGMTVGGGSDMIGVLFKTNSDGTGLEVKRNFVYSTVGDVADEAGVQLYQAPNGKLYGTTGAGGINGSGVLFEYDPATGIYTRKFDFIPATGSYPISSLVAGSNGKLYGLTFSGGVNNQGVLYEYDYVTNTYTKKVDFSGSNGANPSGGSLYLHTNNKLYGVTSAGGVNSFGVLFEYDPATNTYTKKIDFSGTTGQSPYGGLTVAPNGLFYGTTINGGVNSLGVLYQYNLSTNVLIKRVDFTSSEGSFPVNSLITTSNGKLYGAAVSGGVNNVGVLFEYDPSTNTYAKKFDFASTQTGSSPIGGLMKASNGKLYGMTAYGGASNGGVLYEYDAATNTYSKKLDFYIDPNSGDSPNGFIPRSTLFQASNGLFYGTTSQGGMGNNGVLFEYNLTANTYTRKVDFNSAPLGKIPYGGLIIASNSKLYGLTSEGGMYDAGVLFEFNPADQTFTKKHDFERINGGYPKGRVIQAANGKLYGLTPDGGATYDGVLFEFDLATGLYSKKYEFNEANGIDPNGSLMMASNNKLYGMTKYGGANNYGVIFEFDPATSLFTKKIDLDFSTGSNPSGDLIQASNGKLYGLTEEGGFGADGVLFEYDPATNIYSKKFDFDDFVNQKGRIPQGSLQLTSNGKLYGMTSRGGVNDDGVLFEYDINSNVLTKKFDFGSVNGVNPVGSLSLSSNRKLYGGTVYGGASDRGILFEFDPSTNSFIKKVDFVETNGASPYYGSFLFVKGEQTVIFNTLPSKTVVDVPFTVVATSSASLPVTYTSSNTAVATVSGNIITIVGAGTTTITASQSGDANYNAAANVDQTLTVDKVNQLITFNALATKDFGSDAFTLSATTSSVLLVSYTSSNTAVATISGNTATIVGAGTTTITASQSGNSIFNAAADVAQTLNVNKINQTISFNALADKVIGDTPFTLTASATSGLAVTFSTTSDKITLNGNQVSIVSAGRVGVSASQAGNMNFNAATSVERSFCIKPATPVISISNDNTELPVLTSSATLGNQWFLNGTAIAGAINATLNASQAGIYAVQAKVDDCLSERSAEKALIVTGDIEDSDATPIHIYPNPVSEWLIVSLGQLSGVKDIAVFHINGAKMESKKVAGQEAKFDVGNYSTGIYVIKVKADGRVSAIRFEKK